MNHQSEDWQYSSTKWKQAEEGNGDRTCEVLYDYVVDPAASHPEGGDFWGVSSHGENSPFSFLEVDDCWETYPSALTDTILPPC